jgi:lipopolysaccharide export system protein LptC
MIIGKSKNIFKAIIGTIWMRCILVIMLLASLIGLYWINVAKYDFNYPTRYEDAFGISGWLIIIVILVIILIGAGFRIDRSEKEQLKKKKI